MTTQNMLSLEDVVMLARTQMRWIVAAAFAGMLLGLAAWAVVGRNFIASSTIKPETASSALGRFSGIASQLGIATAGVEGGESLEFYARLVESRLVLETVLRSTLQTEDGTLPAYEVFEVAPNAPRQDRHDAIEELRKRIATRIDVQAGLVTITTKSKDPVLAEALNMRLLQLLDSLYVEEARRSRAENERMFIQGRLDEAAGELRKAEAAFQRFLERNRTYQASPQLSFEAARLESEVALRQRIKGSLEEAFEQARIDEVRNTPVFTTIDSPEGSAETGSSFVVYLLGGMAAALALALLGLMMRWMWAAGQAAPQPMSGPVRQRQPDS